MVLSLGEMLKNELVPQLLPKLVPHIFALLLEIMSSWFPFLLFNFYVFL